MNTQPRLALGLPLSAQTLRHSVSKPECNEVDCAVLLPMWQAIFSETNIGIWIEEARVGHRRAVYEGMAA
jgi:hypothetical protein